MLANLIDNSRSDKNTYHTYLNVYEQLLSPLKEKAQNILEIGIGGGGGSIKLWHDYFTNAHVHAIDRMNIKDVWEELKNKERIHLYTSVNAYDYNFFADNLKNKNFDVILDDGSHLLPDMLFIIKFYLPQITDDGIFIIEDVPNINYFPILRKAVPENLQQYVKTYDLRHKKNRGDDLIFVVNKYSSS